MNEPFPGEAFMDLFDEALHSARLGSSSDINRGQISDGYHTFDELYEHRNILFILLLRGSVERAWRANNHSDGSMFEGYFIAGLVLPTGKTITYHLPVELWELLDFSGIQTSSLAPEWDGHTPQDVVSRMQGSIQQEISSRQKAIAPLGNSTPDSRDRSNDIKGTKYEMIGIADFFTQSPQDAKHLFSANHPDSGNEIGIYSSPTTKGLWHNSLFPGRMLCYREDSSSQIQIKALERFLEQVRA